MTDFPDLSVKVEILAGCSIGAAVTQMKSLSKRLGCKVVADFNDVHLCITESAHVPAAVREYHAQLEHGRSLKMVVA